MNDRGKSETGCIVVGGGPAGLELDRVEFALGSPPNTLLLASSEGHSDLITLVNEEFTVVPPNVGERPASPIWLEALGACYAAAAA